MKKKGWKGKKENDLKRGKDSSLRARSLPLPLCSQEPHWHAVEVP